MKSIKINLRKVLAIAICLAVTTIFASCEKEEDPNNGAGKPDAVMNLAATAGNTQVSLTWDEPTDNGGEEITAYEVTADNWTNKVTKTASELSHTCTGLTNGTEYTFKVRAVNANGAGAERSAKATPTAGGTGGGNGGDFTKRTFKTVKEVMDFFPQGVYVYEFEDKSWNNDITLYAKAADGSFSYSEMEGDPKRSDYGETDNFHIWKGEHYYSVNYTNDSKEHITRWWLVQADYPGENLLQSEDTKYGMKTISVSTPWGGIPTAAPGETLDVFSFLTIGLTPWLSFITSDDCEKAVFDGNTTVEGIACKKYRIDVEGLTLNGTIITEPYSKFYYVLDNGFCLKSDDQSQYSMTNFTLKKAEKTPASCDAIFQTYYIDSDTYNKPSGIASMQILTHMRNGEGWGSGAAPSANGSWVIPWTAGGIKWMSYFYDLGKSAPHTINAELDLAKFTEADRTAYIGKVKAIPLMKVTAESDQTIQGYRIATFKSNNNDESWGDNLDFGESYYYIKYECPITSTAALGSASVHIIWVKVTIV